MVMIEAAPSQRGSNAVDAFLWTKAQIFMRQTGIRNLEGNEFPPTLVQNTL